MCAEMWLNVYTTAHTKVDYFQPQCRKVVRTLL